MVQMSVVGTSSWFFMPISMAARPATHTAQADTAKLEAHATRTLHHARYTRRATQPSRCVAFQPRLCTLRQLLHSSSGLLRPCCTRWPRLAPDL